MEGFRRVDLTLEQVSPETHLDESTAQDKDELTEAQLFDLAKYFEVLAEGKSKRELAEEITEKVAEFFGSEQGNQAKVEIERRYNGIVPKIKGGHLRWLKMALIFIPLIAAELPTVVFAGKEKPTQIENKEGQQVSGESIILGGINQKKEKRGELSLREKNERLLLKDEFVVPEEVIKAYSEVVDPTMIGVPAGGYFKKDYLNTPEEKKSFKKRIEDMGYGSKDLLKFKRYFSGKNIVFNYSELEKENFKDILAHERLHKCIAFLPEQEGDILNKARDYIINDYRAKEAQWSGRIDKLLVDGSLKIDDYPHKERELIEKFDPILLDFNGGTGGLIPVLRNADEFYPYLMMNKLSPKVDSFIRSKFPEAHLIYEILKNKINNQIEENIQF